MALLSSLLVVVLLLLALIAPHEVAGFSTSRLLASSFCEPAASSPRIAKTKLLGWRRKNRKDRFASSKRITLSFEDSSSLMDDISTKKRCGLAGTFFGEHAKYIVSPLVLVFALMVIVVLIYCPFYCLLLCKKDTLDTVEHWRELHKQRKRRRKHLWILYTIGFFATFPVGPLLFLSIRNRHAIRQDLGLSILTEKSGSSTRSLRKDETRSKVLLEQSRQADEALEESTKVLKNVRQDMAFDEKLVQRFDEQIKQLYDKAQAAFLSSSEDNKAEEIARQYLEERQDLKDKKEVLEQKLQDERQRLYTLQDSVWSLQSRSMELHEQMREEASNSLN